MRKCCRFFYCLARSETFEFNRLPCPNNEMYGDAVFAIRLRYQLAIFGIRVLIWLSWLLHARIAYITDGAKIIAAFCRISYCLDDLIRLNSIVGYVQITNVRWYGFQWSILISIDYVWRVYIHGAISTPQYSYCVWNSYIKITTGNWLDAGNDLSCRTVV